MMKSDSDLIITEYIGREGSFLLYQDHQEAFRDRFSMSFHRILNPEIYVRNPDLRSPEEKAAAIKDVLAKANASYYQEIGAGGLFSALWELAEDLKCGLDIEIDEIPIRQETIEICEAVGVNPYYLESGKEVFLAAVDQSASIIRQLKEKGISAKVIGCTTGRNARILHQAGNIRYLDKPRDAFLQHEER